MFLTVMNHENIFAIIAAKSAIIKAPIRKIATIKNGVTIVISNGNRMTLSQDQVTKGAMPTSLSTTKRIRQTVPIPHPPPAAEA